MIYTTALNVAETQALKENVITKSTPFSVVHRIRRAVRFFVFASIIFATLATLVIGFADPAFAARKKSKASRPAENPLYSAIVLDAQTGEVLMARQADSIRHPASLTKMMTLYMTFEAINAGRMHMGDRLYISTHAAQQSPSKLGIRPGGSIRVEDAIQIIVTKSANDIAVAMGERLGGSERGFAAKMTQKARSLGMTRTNFRNASGLPDPQQVTTARDMAKLAMALLRDFPQYYHYFGVRNFEYQGAVHVNHNRLLGHYPGLDGIKTGYINASGFNLVASAKQNGRRLIGVVFGGKSWRSRNDHMVKLLNQGFSDLRTRRSPAIQEASLPSVPRTAPVPLPPPMVDDVRGAPIDANANETDSAEDSDTVADSTYASGNAQQVNAMIEQIQPVSDDAGAAVQAAPAMPIAVTPQTPENAPPPSLPAHRPDAAALSSPVVINKTTVTTIIHAPAPPQAAATATTTKTPPASATRMVMQLRIPRAQLPKGIAQSQIASTSSVRGWSIQVGAFPSRAMTDQALRTAQSRLPAQLKQAQPVIVPQSTGKGVIFRARLQGYNELDANAACAHLESCLVVAPGS